MEKKIKVIADELRSKLIEAQNNPGLLVEVEKDAASMLGAFRETALTEEEAVEAIENPDLGGDASGA